MGPVYRLDQLGWMQFERLCSLVLEADAALAELRWLGRADRGRLAVVEAPAALPGGAGASDATPLNVVVLWAPDGAPLEARLAGLRTSLSLLPADVGVALGERLLVLTNLPGDLAAQALRGGGSEQSPRLVVWGATELSAAIDRHPRVRLAMPSVLGLRDLAPLVPAPLRARSSLQVERTQALARVFWPTRAHRRALDVLARHRFVVLTGPPEMGKTAIAEMIGLAQLSCGWEVHDCTSPDQLWRAFDRSRPQVFIADDAFGSTEYRPDAAERWADALARVLEALGPDHWLIWTSRPAPLKAGLRRLERERQAERFPAPREVLVDATDLDLAEKTMILFRHAKARGAGRTARSMLRQAAPLVVDHPHFTPERIRRFVSDRLGVLCELVGDDGEATLWLEVERELSTPTEAMRTSFAALPDEHRELLISLLDAPAGLIGSRELARVARRHRSGGPGRAPDELIDRLTDHFLRVTPLGIDWVHPSWRDLVIEQLAEDAAARRRFLAACGVDGVILALSGEGGSRGERAMPLLRDDADWDVLGSRVGELVRSAEDQDLARIMVALREALEHASDLAVRRELTPLARSMLSRSARRWDADRRAVAPFLVEAWYGLDWVAGGQVGRPALAYTWVELHPGSPAPGGGLERAELVRADEWLAFAHVLARYDPDALAELGFFAADRELLDRLIRAIQVTIDPDCQALARSVLVRIQEIALDDPEHRKLARRALEAIDYVADSPHWWVPKDLPAPPSREPVATGPVEFTRDDVDRVFSDL